jgi:hypothetical protein
LRFSFHFPFISFVLFSSDYLISCYFISILQAAQQAVLDGKKPRSILKAKSNQDDDDDDDDDDVNDGGANKSKSLRFNDKDSDDDGDDIPADEEGDAWSMQVCNRSTYSSHDLAIFLDRSIDAARMRMENELTATLTAYHFCAHNISRSIDPSVHVPCNVSLMSYHFCAHTTHGRLIPSGSISTAINAAVAGVEDEAEDCAVVSTGRCRRQRKGESCGGEASESVVGAGGVVFKHRFRQVASRDGWCGEDGSEAEV